MSKKYLLIIFLALALSLNACQLPLSKAPATPTPGNDLPVPAATSAMSVIEIALTQTAIATSGLPMPAAGDVTNTPGGAVVNPTFTPLAGVNQTPVVVLPSNTPLPSPTSGVPAAINTPNPVAKPATYALHAGEFPYCLARRFNVNQDQLLSLNGLNNYQNYYAPGTVITIPQSGGPFVGTRALKSHPVQYTVRSGDTIYSIACEFGDVDPLGIASANNLGGSYSLTVGSTIQIP